MVEEKPDLCKTSKKITKAKKAALHDSSENHDPHHEPVFPLNRGLKRHWFDIIDVMGICHIYGKNVCV